MIFGGYAVYQMTLKPLSWDSIVAIVLATPFLIAGVYALIGWAINVVGKRTFFLPEYQHTQETHDFKYTAVASQQEQYIQTSIVMTVECNVEFLGIVFEGEGTLPKITGLYDWQLAGRKTHEWIKTYTLAEDKDYKGRWYWYYMTPHHRFKKTRITIGISYLATDSFNGHILFAISCKEGTKRQELPFTVIKKASI